MDLSFFTTPTGIAIIAAGSSFVAGLLGPLISSSAVRATHKQRLAADEALAERKLEFDKELAERKFRYDRDLHDHKRRVELAEQALTAFYEGVLQSHDAPASRPGFRKPPVAAYV